MTSAPKTRPRVLILNHAAAPRDAPGGTRHIELIHRFENWDGYVLAARQNALTGVQVSSEDARYLTAASVSPLGSEWRRIAHWLTFAISAVIQGIRTDPVPDVIVGSSPHLSTALAAWVVAKARRRPFVLEIRDIWPRILVDMNRLSEDSRQYRLLRRIERFLYRRADRIVVVTGGMIQYLLDEGVKRSQIVLIPNGADVEDFASTTSKAEWRTRFDLSGFVAIYAGAHGVANGLTSVLDAAKDLQVELPDVRFVLIGSGPTKDDLIERSVQLGLTNVEFREPIPKSEIRGLLASADVGLHCLVDVPLFKHGLSPNKVFDYLAAGLPVVTNAVGEVGEFGGSHAVMYAEIGQGIRKLHSLSESERREMGQAGRALVSRHHSRRAMARRLELMLDEVRGAKSSRQGR